LLAAAQLSDRPLVTVFATDGSPAVRVPIEAFRLAREGEAPPNRAPWGESHEPWTTRPWGDSKHVLYSPYSVPENASREFSMWQLERAVRAVYGVDEAADVEITPGVDGAPDVVPVPPPEGAAGLAASLRAPVLPAILVALLVPWFLLYTLYMRTIRAGTSERIRGVGFWVPLAVLLAVHILQFTPLVREDTDLLAYAGMIHIGLRSWAGRMPGGWAGVWGVCLAAAAAAYVLAQEGFVRVESSPGDEKKFSLLDRE